MNERFLGILEKNIKKNWEYPALTDYKGATHQYKDIARKIVKLQIAFEEYGIKKGDKIAIVGRNSANWAITFIATLSYGAVVVPILHEFKPESIHHIVNHSDAKLLFVGDTIWENLEADEMQGLLGIYSLLDFSPLAVSEEKYAYALDNINLLFGTRFPKSFSVNDLKFHVEGPEELALISYTSGTTSHSKGVMLPYRSLLSNLLFAFDAMKPIEDDHAKIISLLPLAHMYGMAFEFLYGISRGWHIYFLNKTPSPQVIFEAFNKIKPNLIVSVPLIIEKIYKKQIQPTIERPAIKALLKLPIIDTTVTNQIRNKLISVFGGDFYEIIIGGAPFNKESEYFFKRMHFPYTVGYGMTECGPIISYAPWDEHKLYSCGKAAPRMQIRIDAETPQQIGEILVRGDNVMLGYYKNEKATQATFTRDGWLKTGDLGCLDEEGNLFIKGRSKSMILGPSGQNIYPEEIEDQINSMPYVNESLVLDMGNGKLEACIYPDFVLADQEKLTLTDLQEIMENNRKDLNGNLPAYSQISQVRIFTEEFEKTPKRSIKRFLYQINKS